MTCWAWRRWHCSSATFCHRRPRTHEEVGQVTACRTIMSRPQQRAVVGDRRRTDEAVAPVGDPRVPTAGRVGYTVISRMALALVLMLALVLVLGRVIMVLPQERRRRLWRSWRLAWSCSSLLPHHHHHHHHPHRTPPQLPCPQRHPRHQLRQHSHHGGKRTRCEVPPHLDSPVAPTVTAQVQCRPWMMVLPPCLPIMGSLFQR